jgi:hypothetical protein
MRVSPWYRCRGAVPACKCLASHISILRTYLQVSVRAATAHAAADIFS